MRSGLKSYHAVFCLLCCRLRKPSTADCVSLIIQLFQVTPLLVWLPVLCRPKEGAVGSTFNEQSQTLSPCLAGTAGCLADGASVDLITWFTPSQRLGCCCTGAENSTVFGNTTLFDIRKQDSENDVVYIGLCISCFYFLHPIYAVDWIAPFEDLCMSALY